MSYFLMNNQGFNVDPGFSISPYPNVPVFGQNAPPLEVQPDTPTPLFQPIPDASPQGSNPNTQTSDHDIYDIGMGGGFAGGGYGGDGRNWDDWIKHEKEENEKDRAIKREIEAEKRRAEREHSKRQAKVAYWGMGADVLQQAIKPPPAVTVGSTKQNPELVMFRRRRGGLLGG